MFEVANPSLVAINNPTQKSLSIIFTSTARRELENNNTISKNKMNFKFSSPFFDLPRELRDEIYSYVLTHKKPIQNLRQPSGFEATDWGYVHISYDKACRKNPCEKLLESLSLLTVNRQVFQEAQESLLENNTIVINHSSSWSPDPWFFKMLKQAPKLEIRLVYSTIGIEDTVAFLVEHPRLHVLHLNFCAIEDVIEREDNRSVTERELEEARNEDDYWVDSYDEGITDLGPDSDTRSWEKCDVDEREKKEAMKKRLELQSRILRRDEHVELQHRNSLLEILEPLRTLKIKDKILFNLWFYGNTNRVKEYLGDEAKELWDFLERLRDELRKRNGLEGEVKAFGTYDENTWNG
jgi:hypothetical protein